MIADEPIYSITSKITTTNIPFFLNRMFGIPSGADMENTPSAGTQTKPRLLDQVRDKIRFKSARLGKGAYC